MVKAKPKRSLFKRILRIVLKIVLYFFAISILSTILFRFVPLPVTPLMVIRVFQQWGDGKDAKMKKDWVSFDEMSKNAVLAAMAAEDQNFMKHWGFDFKAIDSAMKHNKKSKRKRGASTISQQTAKNVFLWPGRTWIRKGFEVYFTALIELLWSKERIIEVYLNVAEMGDGIYGIEMASQTYFHKPASKLSKGEAALIIATLPNPRKWNPAKPTGYLLKRQQWIVGQIPNMDHSIFKK